jgi:hypothetical protein
MDAVVEKDKAIRGLVETAVRSYATGFEARHVAQRDDPDDGTSEVPPAAIPMSRFLTWRAGHGAARICLLIGRQRKTFAHFEVFGS